MKKILNSIPIQKPSPPKVSSPLSPQVPLSSLKAKEKGIVQKMNTPEEVTHRLLEMGIAPGEMVTFIRNAPLGDPIEIEVMNYRLAIRRSEADKILLKRSF